jgi:hypothetical protein
LKIAKREAQDADLRRATNLLRAMADGADIDFIWREYRYLSMTLMEAGRDGLPIRMVARRAENYLAARGHPEVVLIRSMSKGL